MAHTNEHIASFGPFTVIADHEDAPEHDYALVGRNGRDIIAFDKSEVADLEIVATVASAKAEATEV